MKALQKIIRTLKLDAMTPEFKAANDELLKAIKLNDKSGAIPHAEFEAVNKAFKANDSGKAAELLKKIQINLSKAEKKLNDEVKDVSQREADAKKENEDAKLKSKNAKATQGLFDKVKTLANSLKTSPKSASKLTPIAEKLKAYGDISGKANKVIQLVAANKDSSKQIDILIKAVDSAEKKFKKELAEIQKSEKAAKDKFEVLKMRLKVTKGKLDAFTKERFSIAKVVKQIPDADLRIARGNKQPSVKEDIPTLRAQSSELREKLNSIVSEIKREWSKYAYDYNDYIGKAKKTIWACKESIGKLSCSVQNARELSPREVNEIYKKKTSARADASEIIRKAYKFFEPKNIDSVIAESDKARGILKINGIEYDPGIFNGIINLEPLAKSLNEKGRQSVYGVKLEDIDREDFFDGNSFIEKHMNKNPEYEKYKKVSSKLRDLLKERRSKKA